MSEEKYIDQIEGRNSVIEVLKSDRDINKLYIQKEILGGSISEIYALAKQKRVVIVEMEKSKLDKMSQTDKHQGVIAMVPPYEYSSVEEILDEANSKNEKPFILILDGIEDPHNLGSIIRTAECAGVHGIILPKRRSAMVNSTVVKTSVGATEHIKIAVVTNLNDCIKMLKEYDIWVYGADMLGSQNYNEEKYTTGVALVIGNEGKGISKLVKENCDILVKIPMKGKINSLNASVSAGIIMYEVMNQLKK